MRLFINSSSKYKVIFIMEEYSNFDALLSTVYLYIFNFIISLRIPHVALLSKRMFGHVPVHAP